MNGIKGSIRRGVSSRAKEVISPPLFCPYEAPAGVLSSTLGPPTQIGCGAFGKSSEGGHEDDPGAGAPVL